jgi:mycothiol synthase
VLFFHPKSDLVHQLSVHIRSFTWSYLAILAQVMSAAHTSGPGVGPASPDQLGRQLKQPGSFPEEDVFLAWEEKTAVGYGVLGREPPIGRAVLSYGVVPNAQRRGISQLLLNRLIEHAQGLGVNSLQAELPEASESDQALLRAVGFIPVRTHLYLRRNSSEPVGHPVPQGYTFRPMAVGEVEALTKLQNATFMGSWGYAPNTPEEIQYRIYDLHEWPNDVLVLEWAGELVAYCWSYNQGEGKPGQIVMLGVDPRFWGLGLGKVVTSASINLLLSHGALPILLTVDSKNTQAVRIYQALGFEETWASRWFELRLA